MWGPPQYSVPVFHPTSSRKEPVSPYRGILLPRLVYVSTSGSGRRERSSFGPTDVPGPPNPSEYVGEERLSLYVECIDGTLKPEDLYRGTQV